MNTEFLIIITIIAVLFLITTKEGFSSGALTQLVAKGPQDRYLTNNDYNYHPYPEFLWNNGTRISSNYPYYIHYVDHLYYPYYQPYSSYHYYHPHHPYNYFF
jgi:hypothetical protein